MPSTADICGPGQPGALVQGLALPEASVDHPSIMIRGQKPCQDPHIYVDWATVVLSGGCGAHHGKCRPSGNPYSRSKNHAKRRRDVWFGPRQCFVDGVGLTEGVHRRSMMIRRYKSILSIADMCGLAHGISLWMVCGSSTQV